MSMNNVQGICFVFGFFVFLLFFVFCVVFLTWFKARSVGRFYLVLFVFIFILYFVGFLCDVVGCVFVY